MAADPHLAFVRPVVPRTPEGCEECLRIGSPWVHLRLCLTCGHVGCCDSSPNRHARAHALRRRAPDRPVLRARRGLALVLRRRDVRLSVDRRHVVAAGHARKRRLERRCRASPAGRCPAGSALVAAWSGQQATQARAQGAWPAREAAYRHRHGNADDPAARAGLDPSRGTCPRRRPAPRRRGARRTAAVVGVGRASGPGARPPPRGPRPRAPGGARDARRGRRPRGGGRRCGRSARRDRDPRGAGAAGAGRPHRPRRGRLRTGRGARSTPTCWPGASCAAATSRWNASRR